jgi:hypothetical protein
MIFRIEVWIALDDEHHPAGEMVCEIDDYLRR